MSFCCCFSASFLLNHCLLLFICYHKSFSLAKYFHHCCSLSSSAIFPAVLNPYSSVHFTFLSYLSSFLADKTFWYSLWCSILSYCLFIICSYLSRTKLKKYYFGICLLVLTFVWCLTVVLSSYVSPSIYPSVSSCKLVSSW